MAVTDTLKKLEDLVADASHLPFSDKALVNDDEIVHLVEEHGSPQGAWSCSRDREGAG